MDWLQSTLVSYLTNGCGAKEDPRREGWIKGQPSVSDGEPVGRNLPGGRNHLFKLMGWRKGFNHFAVSVDLSSNMIH